MTLAFAMLRVCALIQRLEDHGLLEDRAWNVSEQPRSSWICVAALPVHPADDERIPPYRFVIQRNTGELYAVGPDGAVGDTPINLGDITL